MNSHYRLHVQTEKALAAIDRIAFATCHGRSAYEQRNGEKLARLQDIRDLVKDYLDETDEMVDPDLTSALKGTAGESQKAIKLLQGRIRKSNEVTKRQARTSGGRHQACHLEDQAQARTKYCGTGIPGANLSEQLKNGEKMRQLKNGEKTE